jgi:hypothetical protein
MAASPSPSPRASPVVRRTPWVRPKKRQGLFQLSLTTALILTVTSGLLLGANVVQQKMSLPRSGVSCLAQGWPFHFFADWDRQHEKEQLAEMDLWFDAHPSACAADLSEELGEMKTKHGLAYDIVVCLGIAFGVAVVSELLVRRAA